MGCSNSPMDESNSPMVYDSPAARGSPESAFIHDKLVHQYILFCLCSAIWKVYLSSRLPMTKFSPIPLAT